MAPAQNITPKRSATPAGPAPKVQVTGMDDVVRAKIAQSKADPRFTGTEADAIAAGKQEVMARLQSIQRFVGQYGEFVRSDNGQMHLVAVDVHKGDARVQLSGACSACALSDRTLNLNMKKALAAVKQDPANGLEWLNSVNGDVLEVTDRTELRHDFEIGTGGFRALPALERAFGGTSL